MLVLGIAGGSGSGKTTIVRRLAESLPLGSVSVIDHDRYYRHRPDLPLHMREKLNYDHPDALETELLVEHLRNLRKGNPVQIPVYDFKLHARLPLFEVVMPAPILLTEGILLFENSHVRDLLDIKVFVDSDSDIRLLRRIQRDVQERGRLIGTICSQYEGMVKPMHELFVEPSKRWADLILRDERSHVVLELLLGKCLQYIHSLM